MQLLLESFNHPGTTYEVKKDIGTCSCSVFAEAGWCEHLEAVGRYNTRRVTLSSRPSFSQALSGLVKGIRLRDEKEAAHWLYYCWNFRTKLEGAQFRTVRRLLIGSAEDGHSIAVMENMADSFVPLLSKEAKFEDVLVELLRICRVPNWWHPDSNGPDYIRSGMLGYRKRLYTAGLPSVEECLLGIERAIENQDRVDALYWVMRADQTGVKCGRQVADTLLRSALMRNHLPAVRLMRNIYFRHSQSLSQDNNFACQAAWLLAGGVSPLIDEAPQLGDGEVGVVMDYLHSNPVHVIPEWCCDGVHCGGNDIRYAGMWDRMYAVCQQYSHYQRMNPNDPWIEEAFYSFDGLHIVR